MWFNKRKSKPEPKAEPMLNRLTITFRDRVQSYFQLEWTKEEQEKAESQKTECGADLPLYALPWKDFSDWFCNEETSPDASYTMIYKDGQTTFLKKNIIRFEIRLRKWLA